MQNKQKPTNKTKSSQKTNTVSASEKTEGSSLSANQLAIGDSLRLPKLSHLAAEKLRDQIVSGELKPGSVLSPESQLTKLFDISRPTLREALRILESQGLIKIGRGNRSGAIVLGPSIKKAAEYTSYILVNEGVTLLDLHEARMFIEPEILRNLEGSAQSKAASNLRKNVEEMEQALEEQRFDDVVTGSARFHEALAQAANNFPIALLTNMLQTITDQCYTTVLGAEGVRARETFRDNLSKTVSAYSALCDHLENDSGELAADYWHNYMKKARNFLKRSKLSERKLVQRSIASG